MSPVLGEWPRVSVGRGEGGGQGEPGGGGLSVSVSLLSRRFSVPLLPLLWCTPHPGGWGQPHILAPVLSGDALCPLPTPGRAKPAALAGGAAGTGRAVTQGGDLGTRASSLRGE